MQAIPGVVYDRASGYYKVVGGCANVANLPPVTFTIGGAALDLQPQQWTRPVMHLQTHPLLNRQLVDTTAVRPSDCERMYATLSCLLMTRGCRPTCFVTHSKTRCPCLAR